MTIPNTVDGKPIPIVTSTYRFNEPSPILSSVSLAVVIDHTPGYADTTAMNNQRERLPDNLFSFGAAAYPNHLDRRVRSYRV
jgi:hypothetical protein